MQTGAPQFMSALFFLLQIRCCCSAFAFHLKSSATIGKTGTTRAAYEYMYAPAASIQYPSSITSCTMKATLSMRSKRTLSATIDAGNGESASTEMPSDNDTRMIHFNNAGASPSPPVVVQTMTDHLAREVELGGYLAAAQVQSELEGVYASILRLVHGGADPDDVRNSSSGNTLDGKHPRNEIALVESATVGWTRIFYSMAECVARRARIEAMEAAAAFLDPPDQTALLERIILMSEAEYAANVVAAVKFCREQNEMVGSISQNAPRVRWRVLTIPSTTYMDANEQIQSTGVVDTEALEKMLSGKWMMMNDSQDVEEERYLDPKSIAMVCVTHIPTNSGIVNPVDEIGTIIEKYNARQESQTKMEEDSSNSRLPRILYLVDACQSVGQIDINVRTMHCHALTATGRKYLRGPRGTGFLYIQQNVAEALIPSHVDHAAAPVSAVPTLSAQEMGSGGSIDLTDRLDLGYQPGAARFEFWESNIAAKLGLGGAIDYALDMGMTVIERRCCHLGAELRSRLRSMDRVQVFHDNIDKRGTPMTKQCGIVVFGVEGVESSHIKTSLLCGGLAGSARFEVSVVPATSTPADSAKTRAADLVRASLSYENTLEEVEMFVQMLEVVLRKYEEFV